ncbi:hypothetical protein B0J17DRAFT_634012 [Rhizoctonia solani]|nr:hypothetical protein B0J17DRAFT_634012 [Rhizoctonia solani]
MSDFLSQSFPPKSLFAVEQIPDLTRQALLNKNAKVYLAARSRSKADETIDWLKNETGEKAPLFLELDLSSLGSIRKAAEGFKSGVMTPPAEQRTIDGYDLQFGTNVLGHYFFTTLLLPTLIYTAKNSPLALYTSSGMLYSAPKGDIVWETLGTDALSGNVLFSNELAKRYADQGVISSSLHPAIATGSIQTDLLRHWPWLIAKLLSLICYPASYGALTQLWSGTMPEGEKHNGKFLIPWARIGDAGPYSHDEKLAERL